MFKNYLKITVRNLIKQKSNTAINVIGLAFGIACSILAFLFVRAELTFDRFHEKAERVFKITLLQSLAGEGSEQLIGLSPIPLGPGLEQNFPEVKHMVRFRGTRGVIKTSAGVFRERFQFADPNIFDVFTFPLLLGNPETALRSPNSIVLSEKMAKKYFGEDVALDKYLQVKLADEVEKLIVTGVMQDIPANSSLQFDFLLAFERVNAPDWAKTSYSTNTVSTYLLLPDGETAVELESKARNFLAARWPESKDTPAPILKLQALTDVHLDSDVAFTAVNTSHSAYSYILSCLAFAVLLIACVNFMILSVGRSSSRGKEVGLRKVMGAHRSHLLKQFWGEAVFLSFIALFIGVALAEALLPRFNLLANKNLQLRLFSDPTALLALVVIAIFVGLVAGSYPALLMSGFQPVAILKGKLKLGSNNFLTRILVVFQFVLSICLIIATMIMSRQLTFLQTKNLGFAREAVVVIPASGDRAFTLLENLKQEIQAYNNILGVSGTSFSFARGGATGIQEVTWQGKKIRTFDFRIDYDFLNVLDIKLIDGRNFSEAYSTDPTTALIVNEALVDAFGWQNQAGESFVFRGAEHTVVGVVQDFHFKSLHEEITPMILHMRSGWPIMHILVRVSETDIAGNLAFLKNKWQAVNPDVPFTYSFLDEDLEQQYQTEKRFTQIVQYSSFLAILIACMGLFGLVAVVTLNRTKEIGIRKVLGASSARILSLLSWDYLKLVLLANLLSWPIAFYFSDKWLQDFAYRIDISWWVFALAGGLALIIALLTVSTQAIRAALANPVESLRYE